MAEKDEIAEQKVKWKGLFHFKDTYTFLYRWLEDEDYNIEEQKYLEEVEGGAKKKIEINWVAEKKLSDYFKIQLKLSWRILGMKDVEVEKDGERVKMNDASIEIKVKGVLVKDYESTWETNPLMKFLRGVYEKFIIEGRVEKYEKKVFGEVNDTTEQIKAFLAIEGKR